MTHSGPMLLWQPVRSPDFLGQVGSTQAFQDPTGLGTQQTGEEVDTHGGSIWASLKQGRTRLQGCRVPSHRKPSSR